MRIAITGGKGGTGKSTIATAIAVKLAQKNKVLLVDADVDCPDDHLLLSITLEKTGNVEKPFPLIDKNKCISCGKCSKVCKPNALVHITGKPSLLAEALCTGCMACQIVCPVEAITRAKRHMGKIKEGKGHGLDLLTGEMEPNEKESAAIVTDLKKIIQEKEADYDFVIIDTAAGSHCPVIIAILDCDLALAVTEPTPLGAHDLKVILETMKAIKVNGKIILNKAGIADHAEIKRIAEKYEIQLIAEIPYSKEIINKYSKGEPIEHDSINKVTDFLETIMEGTQ
ncbi:ATP-binding protein [archaeon]|nr:ATP-binding protein [archaeon]